LLQVSGWKDGVGGIKPPSSIALQVSGWKVGGGNPLQTFRRFAILISHLNTKGRGMAS